MIISSIDATVEGYVCVCVCARARVWVGVCIHASVALINCSGAVELQEESFSLITRTCYICFLHCNR